jgi:hypothetical protein
MVGEIHITRIHNKIICAIKIALTKPILQIAQKEFKEQRNKIRKIHGSKFNIASLSNTNFSTDNQQTYVAKVIAEQ